MKRIVQEEDDEPDTMGDVLGYINDCTDSVTGKYSTSQTYIYKELEFHQYCLTDRFTVASKASI